MRAILKKKLDDLEISKEYDIEILAVHDAIFEYTHFELGGETFLAEYDTFEKLLEDWFIVNELLEEGIV
jgi:hypothetical protein